ncbi:hypothetical protein E2C01_026360 [Portunus trituberculatus]|uniref:Uncharacterized protein n=1 Tax=Portunus trituberculatus TaxID=210409 RepID=A0A5B7EFS7_PORTR|nr:hypothetical protein [Portunus trituberculatus]
MDALPNLGLWLEFKTVHLKILQPPKCAWSHCNMAALMCCLNDMEALNVMPRTLGAFYMLVTNKYESAECTGMPID